MGIADTMAAIALGVSNRLGAGYWPALALTETAPVFDDGGSIIVPGQSVQRACSVQLDAATEAMRMADGFTEGDIRLLVLVGTLSGELDTDARIQITAGPHVGVYSLQSCMMDPAATHWDCRGRRDGRAA